jgi:hypothetical protein
MSDEDTEHLILKIAADLDNFRMSVPEARQMVKQLMFSEWREHERQILTRLSQQLEHLKDE